MSGDSRRDTTQCKTTLGLVNQDPKLCSAAFAGCWLVRGSAPLILEQDGENGPSTVHATKRNVVAVALTPGFLRSERVLEHFGVTEANWRDAGKRRKNRAQNSPEQNDAPHDFMVSESPRYIGRAVVALAADPKVKKKSGRVFSSWALAREYGFTDLDGTRPHWGNYARKKYGKYKICDERFYSYWVPGLVELIFPDWF